MTTPLVSAIIPCYRQASYLPAAIGSVFAQSYPAVEVIVVNDGSDDDTEEVARRYGIKVRYVGKKNGGLASARNAGIRVASGDWLLFLDADDLLHPDAISTQVAAVGDRLQRIAVLGYQKFQACPSVDGQPPVSLVGLRYMPQMLFQNVAPPHSHLVSRKAVLQEGLFSESREIAANEDWDLWLRLALSGAEFIPLPLAGAYYRRYSGSMSTHEMPMLVSRIAVQLNAHRRILADRSLLQRWGVDLAGAERNFYRHCVARGVRRQYTRQLWAAIRELEQVGAYVPKSLRKRALDFVMGEMTERLALTYFRLFDRQAYAYYNKPNP
jgi:glycosyltransferase involved in cell wall biosynthesis